MFPLRSLLTIMAFSQTDVVASLGGTVEMEQTSLCIFVAAHREAEKREARALHPCRPFDEERGSALKRNRFEVPVKILTFDDRDF